MDTETRTTLAGLMTSVREDVRNEAEYLRETAHPDDHLHEIADSGVPIYNYDLAQALASDLTLGYPEDGALDGAENIFAVIQRAIYERLMEAAQDEWRIIQAEDES